MTQHCGRGKNDELAVLTALADLENRWNESNTRHVKYKLTSICNRSQDIIKSTAWLEVTTIRIDVNVTHRHPNPNAQAKGECVGVQDIHKVCVIRREPPADVCPFKHGSCGIQTCSKESQDGLSQSIKALSLDLRVQVYRMKMLTEPNSQIQIQQAWKK